MITLSTAETWEYTLLEDRASADPTVFILRPLKEHQQVELENLLMADSAERAMGTLNHKACKWGIAGFRNLGGAEYATDKDGLILDDLLARLGMRRKMELGSEIWRRSALDESDVKN